MQIPKTATTDTIMDSLLDLPTMQMTIHNQYITHLAYLEPSHPDTHQQTTPLISFSPPTQSLSPTNDDLEELDLFMADDSPTDNQPKADRPPAPSPTSVSD